MANSILNYTYQGQANFACPPFLDEGDISVQVNGITLPTDDWSINSLNQVVISATLNTDDEISITRRTANSERAVSYSNGSILKAETLDKDSKQAFYLAQEAYDQSNITNLAAGTFYYAQEQAPTDPLIGTLWYKTSSQPNVLKVYDGSGWVDSAPIYRLFQYMNQGYIDNNASSVPSGVIAIEHDPNGYSKASHPAINASSQVLLNGVRLVATELPLTNIGVNGDYVIDGSDVYVGNLVNDDILSVETWTGSVVDLVSEAVDTVTQSESTIQGFVDDYTNTYYPQMQQSDQLASEAIQAKNDVDGILSNIANIDDYITQANFAKNFATHDTDVSFSYTDENGQTQNVYSAKHFKDKAEAAKVAAEGFENTTAALKASVDVAKEAAENAANVSADVLNGWAVVANNTVSTYGAADTEFSASGRLDITAPKGVYINNVPTPRYIGVVDMKYPFTDSYTIYGQPDTVTPLDKITVERVNTAGHYRVKFGQAGSNLHYNSGDDYFVTVQHNGNKEVICKVSAKYTDHFMVFIEDYTTGSGTDTGDFMFSVYEF